LVVIPGAEQSEATRNPGLQILFFVVWIPGPALRVVPE
jgi:hypothetical protein